ncbi:MAG: hypothetical protein GY750_18740 [Lentisphaerae bacterium]|nr:hypothetical protein [Lentisphaerota bacterium]MCP4338833.1 hypothetical protein [Desulfobulbaceae bacterium]
MGNETATDNSMQDIASRVENQLFGSDDATEQDIQDTDVVLDDDANLPESDDTDVDDSEGSDDLDDIANEEELSLASYLGIDEDKLIVNDDGSVAFHAIIDGESKEVPLSDLATSYQLQGHVNNKSIALENERKEFIEQRDTVANELSTRLDSVNSMTKMVEEQLLSEFNGIDWDRLRAENPSEWSALRQEYAERAQKIQGIQSQVGAQQKELQDKQAAEAVKNHQLHMQQEMQKMIAANPTWSNPEVMKAETTELKSFLSESYGFSEADMQYVTDSRLIGLIQDAKAFRQGKKEAEVKITKKVPKFQKPGTPKANSKQLAKARQAKAQKGALKSSGSVQDAASILLNRM